MNATDPTDIAAAPDETSETTPCVDRLCEVAGRDRAVAAALREQAARLIRLAEGLEINAAIGTSAAADLLAD
ncbi:hypothetical protein [Mycolicibacterium smegmatis]|uniref:hypothetical protein n=1 Tax=Mycolicibacterium smegmatis TaxID=1772 RepID=UPI001EFA36DF|nr:hypothetical protein [Mycolicibacterium smegmatis]ULN32584.1 hypothetical protein KZ781_16835 [Mycolicibacterium smegmatis]